MRSRQDGRIAVDVWQGSVLKGGAHVPTEEKVKESGMGDLLYYLIVGLIAGWLAGQVMKGGGYGILVDIVLGILGGFLGGWLFGMLHISLGGRWIGPIITSFVGAVILVWITRLIKKKA